MAAPLKMPPVPTISTAAVTLLDGHGHAARRFVEFFDGQLAQILGHVIFPS